MSLLWAEIIKNNLVPPNFYESEQTKLNIIFFGSIVTATLEANYRKIDNINIIYCAGTSTTGESCAYSSMSNAF